VKVVADPVDEAVQFDPQIVRDGHPVFVVEVDGVHQLAVDVQLQLVMGTFADPDRLGGFVAFQVIQDFLGQIASSVDPVHQLQRAIGHLLVAARL
jgi:hypothetical protein